MFDPSLWSEEQIRAIKSPASMAELLRIRGCSRCSLGTQQGLIKSPVVYRGDLEASIVLLGEGPGLEEDRTGKPFEGPAGQLLKRMFASVGLYIDEDLYIGNCVKCRPIAPEGSGKQNIAPSVEHLKACRPFWQTELKLLNPKLVICCGKIAAQTILNTKEPLKNIVGQFTQPVEDGPFYFVMYHPAAILHSSPFPEEQDKLKEASWHHLKQIRNFWDRQVLGKEELTYQDVTA